MIWRLFDRFSDWMIDWIDRTFPPLDEDEDATGAGIPRRGDPDE